MKKQIKIHIGEVSASKEPAIIKTLLGSCVSVCLFDRTNRIGGMNHILLPGKADMKNYNESARYGINAMELLVNKVIKLGGKKTEFTAKVFGGGHIIGDISFENSPGPKNVAFVMDFLKIEKIPVLSQNTGGNFTRLIYCHTDSSEVYMKRIYSSINPKVAIDEQNYIGKLNAELSKPTDITFF
ncbi:MAG TPA: chemotaxis protein CheD [Ignavibacteriales bacterium]|nr:chemotaxis protein CheD [Ignavibacteriales bacterium]HEX3072177.1 chemotaxis protein CheD [Ignavibacteriales bacterium]